MATVREGNKAVLVIVDVQVGVMSGSWDPERVIKNVARTVERARAEGVPVIWVQHSDEELTYGSPQWQWVPELVPAEGEALVHKKFNSSFEQTELENSSPSLARHTLRWQAPQRIGLSCHRLRRLGAWLRPDSCRRRTHNGHIGTRQWDDD